MLLLKRMRQRALVFAALVTVVAVVSGLSVGIIGFVRAAEVDGVRSQLSQLAGADVALQLSLTTEPDLAAQSARVDGLLATLFRAGDRTFPLEVTTTTSSDNPVQLSIGVKAYAASIPDLESHAELVDGSWPSAPAEVSVQADAAAALGVVPGDVLAVGDSTVTITGTWRVSDPLDPRWVENPLFTDGRQSAVSGPIVFAPDELAAVGATTHTSWAIVPVVSRLEAGDLAVIIGAWRTIADSMRADGQFDVNGLSLNGRFASTATSAQSTVDALAAVVPVALLVIGAIALLTLVELGRLLATLRATETLLFWSRGDTLGALTAVAAAEAAVVAVIGAAAGTVAGILVLAQDPALLGATVWAIPLIVAVAAAIVFAATAFAGARSVSTGGTDEAGRVARVSSVAGPVLLTLAAAVSTWQLLLYGSPLTPARDGGTQIDPIAVLAPALTLLALAALALAALPLFARGLETRASRGLGVALVPRTLVRRTRLLAAPLVLCALATGQLTLAAGYAQTWDTFYTTTAELRSGSQLTATGVRDSLTEEAFDAMSASTAVTVAAPVYTEQVVVGETSATMVAVTPTALTALANTAGGIVDPSTMAGLIATPLSGPRLPEGTREIQVGIAANSDVPVDLSVVIADEYGVQHEIPTSATYSGQIPAGHGAWRVLAIVIGIPDAGPGTLTVTSLTADGEDVPLGEAWTGAGFDPFLTTVDPAPIGAGFRSAYGLLSVRLAPTLGESPDGLRLPVVVTSALAEAAGIRVGDIVPLTLDARVRPFRCIVAAIVPAIPGSRSESAVLVDGSVVEAARAGVYSEPQTPEAAWIGTTDARSSLEALRDAVPPGVTVRSLATDLDRRVLSSASTALWIGAAGAGILAIVALIAAVGAQLRSRRGEVFVLRALGVSDVELVRGRRAELGIVMAAGIVVGLASGAIVTALTIPALARAAVPGAFDSLATTVGLQPLGLGVGLLALVAAFGAVLFLYGRRVPR